MPFDSLSIMALCLELNQAFQNARIDKIHQPERDELVISVRTYDRGNVRLVISANSRWNRMHIDHSRRKNPEKPPAFCMLMRKYLEGGKIKGVKQLGLERIVHFEIEAVNELGDWKERTLVCEFMGKHSNIILVNPENNLIIDAIKRYGSDVSSHREVYPGKVYIAPPPQNKLDPLSSGFETFCTAFWAYDGQTASSSLVKVFMGLSPFAAGQICLQAMINPNMDVASCGELELSRLYNGTRDLIESVGSQKSQASLAYSGSKILDFAAYPIMENPKTRIVLMPDINTAFSRFYDERMGEIRLESSRAELKKKMGERLDRAHKKYMAQQGDFERALENQKYRVVGELLTAYAHQFKKGDIMAELEDFNTGELISIPLDPRYTPIQNASRYFKIYNKSVNTRKHLSDLLSQLKDEIAYLESVLLEIEQADSQEELLEITDELEKEGLVSAKSSKKTNSKTKSQPRHFISSEGLDILVGRNNRQNDRLTFKDAGRSDLWLHSRQMAGSHVILTLPPSVKSIHDVPDRSLEEAAGLAAHFSRGRSSSKVEVDYTFRHQVQKPPGAKPGMVIYHQYWTILIDPDSPVVDALLGQNNNAPDLL